MHVIKKNLIQLRFPCFASTDLTLISPERTRSFSGSLQLTGFTTNTCGRGFCGHVTVGHATPRCPCLLQNHGDDSLHHTVPDSITIFWLFVTQTRTHKQISETVDQILCLRYSELMKSETDIKGTCLYLISSHGTICWKNSVLQWLLRSLFSNLLVVLLKVLRLNVCFTDLFIFVFQRPTGGNFDCIAKQWYSSFRCDLFGMDS